MAEKQLDNNGLESAATEVPEIPDEQLVDVAGGWNTNRRFYAVVCRECHRVFNPRSDGELQQIVTNPCPACGADRTCLYIDPNLSGPRSNWW